MNTITNFKNDIHDWLCRNGFSNIYVDCASDFCYSNDTHTIYCGMEANDEAGHYFGQFIHEYGCENIEFWYPVFCFLHELGHHMTMPNFTNNEILTLHFLKEIQEDETAYDWYFHYWDFMDEFSANMFVVDFINNKLQEVEELEEILMRHYQAMYADGGIWDYIENKEVA